jgi:hypothetical protein
MPSQNGVGESLGISAQDRNATILLIESSGEMKSGAGAIIHLLNMSGGRIGVAVSYLHKRFPWFRFLAERVYACVARHRHLISKIIH